MDKSSNVDILNISQRKKLYAIIQTCRTYSNYSPKVHGTNTESYLSDFRLSDAIDEEISCVDTRNPRKQK